MSAVTSWQATGGLGAAAGRLGAGFDLVLILHVACVVVGLATVVVSGIVAGRLAAALPAPPPAQVLRYYAPGINWAGRVLIGVPVFGFILLAMSHGAYGLNDGWVTQGLVLWVVVAGMTEGLLWPAERQLQMLLRGSGPEPARNPNGAPVTSAEAAIRRACRTIRWVTAGSVVLMVLATVLMVAQP
jgi:hypothetical protein